MVRPQKLEICMNLGLQGKTWTPKGGEGEELVLNGATYCQALKWKHVDYTVREEVVSSQRFGIKRMRGNEFETMVGGIEFPDQVTGRKEMQSVHNYDILSNPHYVDLLLYVPCILPKRSAFVISPYRDVHMRVYAADLVRSVLDLPYLP